LKNKSLLGLFYEKYFMLSPTFFLARDPPGNGNRNRFLASLLLLSLLLITPVHALNADISITKDGSSPGSLVTNQEVTWTVTVLNNGTDSATNVTVIDDLSGLVDVTILSNATSQGTYTVAGTTGTWNIGTLDNGSAATLTLNTTFSTPGIKWNNVSVTSDATDPVPANNIWNTLLVILPPDADLAVSKTASPDPAIVGEEVEWTVTVLNNGPDTAINITVVDDMSGLSGKTILSSNIIGPGTFSVIGDTGTWDVGSLVAGAEAALILRTTFSTPGIKVNNVSVTSDANDPDPSDDFSTDQVVILPPDADLAVSKSASPDSALVKEEVKWTVTVENLGPDTAINITVVDDLQGIGPSTVAPYVASQGTFSIGFPGLIWDVGSLDAGQNATLALFTYRHSPGISTNNVSIIAPDVNDTNPANDADSVSITVQSPPPTQTPRRSGGGGGGGQEYLEFTGKGPVLASNDAQVLMETRIYAADGIMNITLPRGNRVAGANGEPIDFITITQLPINETPGLGDEKDGTFSGYAYDCTPSGALFEYPVIITFTFDEEAWESLHGRDLVIQWWNEDAGVWEPLFTTIDDSARTVSAEVSHFTIFAVFVRAGVPQEPGAEGTATPEVPGVTDEEPELPEPTPTPTAALNAAPLLALAALGFLLRRKR
jgi:uncharacterized repeat protein (TIGR01451 family)